MVSLNEQIKISLNETPNTTTTTATVSKYNQISEKMIDVADLEYDEEFSALVADGKYNSISIFRSFHNVNVVNTLWFYVSIFSSKVIIDDIDLGKFGFNSFNTTHAKLKKKKEAFSNIISTNFILFFFFSTAILFSSSHFNFSL